MVNYNNVSLTYNIAGNHWPALFDVSQLLNQTENQNPTTTLELWSLATY